MWAQRKADIFYENFNSRPAYWRHSSEHELVGWRRQRLANNAANANGWAKADRVRFRLSD